MKKLFLAIFLVIIIAIASTVVYVSYGYLKEKNSVQFTPIVLPTDNDGSGDTQLASSTDLFATSTIDRSSWKTYSNDELGYKISYPADLIVNYDERTLILAFPKKSYFSWPLEDSVKITITASSTCIGLSQYDSNWSDESAVDFTVNSRAFRFSQFLDVAAGNRFDTRSYEIIKGNTCYSLVYYSRGPNGAGLYVDDPVLIKKYDEQHELETESLRQSIIGILDSFEFVSSPDGQLEG